MGTRALPDMYALSPRASCIHIRQSTHAHVITYTYIYVYIHILYIGFLLQGSNLCKLYIATRRCRLAQFNFTGNYYIYICITPYSTVVLYSRDRYKIIGLLEISHSIKQPCSSVCLKKAL